MTIDSFCSILIAVISLVVCAVVLIKSKSIKTIIKIMISCMILMGLVIIRLPDQFDSHANTTVSPSDISMMLYPVVLAIRLIYVVNILILICLIFKKRNIFSQQLSGFDKVIYWLNALYAFPFGLINALLIHRKTKSFRS